jgi:hypothetical protein
MKIELLKYGLIKSFAIEIVKGVNGRFFQIDCTPAFAEIEFIFHLWKSTDVESIEVNIELNKLKGVTV